MPILCTKLMIFIGTNIQHGIWLLVWSVDFPRMKEKRKTWGKKDRKTKRRNKVVSHVCALCGEWAEGGEKQAIEVLYLQGGN